MNEEIKWDIDEMPDNDHAHEDRKAEPGDAVEGKTVRGDGRRKLMITASGMHYPAPKPKRGRK